MKIFSLLFSPARAIARAQREAEARESEKIRTALLRRVDRMERAEANRPEVSRQLEGAIVEVWI